MGASFQATVSAQTGVTAEALFMANLRANTFIESDELGQITSGTRYPVLARNEFYPWFLVGDPTTNQPLGWVFGELVVVQGDINILPFSTYVVGSGVPFVPSFQVSPNPDATTPPTATLAPDVTPTATLPPTSTPASPVTALVQGEINIRYGPGTEYDRLGLAQAGDVFDVIARHTQLPWVKILYPSSPNGEAWINAELLQFTGNLNELPAISQLSFVLPTLTPTPSILEQRNINSGQPVALSPEFTTLVSTLYQVMVDAGFDPATSTLGSLFVMDLQTGEAVAFGDDVAFSGMSVNKIPILMTWFATMTGGLNASDVYTVAEAILCSENISTNEMLAQVGGGNPYSGAERVSEFMQSLGLTNSFIFTPYANDPFITPQAPLTRVTGANQTAAQPDVYNQITTTEVGFMLDSIYQCAMHGTGPLFYYEQALFTTDECRKMIEILSFVRIGTFMEVGIPIDIRIAHKHGWINDTHGEAAMVFSPGGNYIIVIALHAPTWIDFTVTSQVIGEISRRTYNYFNPEAPMSELRVDDTVGDLASCNAGLLSNPILQTLLAGRVEPPTFVNPIPGTTSTQ